MRGKPVSALEGAETARNIPAYAGKTLAPWWRDALAKEHPRVCGENTPMVGHAVDCRGTSPRMRGKLVRVGR